VLRTESWIARLFVSHGHIQQKREMTIRLYVTAAGPTEIGPAALS